jgi:hypothetical protein
MIEATAKPSPEDARKRAKHLERRTTVMKALAHRSRLLMVEALASGEPCVWPVPAPGAATRRSASGCAPRRR